MKDLNEYWRDGLNQIEGWVDRALLDYLLTIGDVQGRMGWGGNIAEIGVFEGRFLIALAHMAAPGSECVAIDIFDDQLFNSDGSSPGAPTRFDDNWQRFSPAGVTLTKVRTDSLALTLFERVDIIRQHGPFRLFSVDGGHTVDHVMHDLAFAQDAISTGGVIIADDYLHSHWLGVTEGVHTFLSNNASKVKPFLCIGNKLFLCSISVHRDYLQALHGRMGSRPHHKIGRLFGWDLLTVANR